MGYYQSLQQKEVHLRSETTREIENNKKTRVDKRLRNVYSIVEEIEENETGKESIQQENVRKYICSVLTPVISEGLLKVVEIKPVDPVDYLAEYLYERSFEF